VTNDTHHPRDDEDIVAIKPGFGAPAAESRQRPAEAKSSRFGPLIAAGAAVVLLVLLGIVFFALPRWVKEDTPAPVAAAPEPPPAEAEPAEPALSDEELAALKTRAESQLTELLQQRSRLEALSAARWGGAEWTEYDELGRASDQALLAERFALAVASYAKALAAGAALNARAEQILASALASARQALGAGNAELAREQYDLVLSIEPNNAEALAGRTRAERLPEALALVTRAEELRRQQSLEEAADLYREVLKLDSEWAPARRALEEINAALANQRLESLLSLGYAALAEEEFVEARKHFEAALALAPASKSAADGLAQAEQGQKLDTIALAEARALAFERREMWPEAIDVYEAALATDSTLDFARVGLERSRARSDLDIKLENLFANPNLLFTDSVLADAGRLADQARAVATPESRIAGQLARLDDLIRLASTPVTVELTSDELTEVTVYRVGQLGVFATKALQVRPGTYTAIGSRDGYRDVRATFTVLPGRTLPPINVVCTEPIA
jgi:tetratricopeptide (TPR) repeat protein